MRHSEETNNTNDEIVSHGNIMAKKRIYNPTTDAYYKLREKTTANGRTGQIMGRWSSKKRK